MIRGLGVEEKWMMASWSSVAHSKLLNGAFSFLLFLLLGCSETDYNGASKRIVEAGDVEELRSEVDLVKSNLAGWRILSNALHRALELDRSEVLSQAKVEIICTKMHNLASQGVFNQGPQADLIVALDYLLAFESTYSPAETLRIITGVDTGYTRQFVDGYTEKDEPERRRKIEQWRSVK